MPDTGLFITTVEARSPAEKAGIQSGDTLLCINGEEVHDTIEYRYLICEKKLLLQLRNTEGKIYEALVQKGMYEDLGIDYQDPLLERSMRCSNKCVFCFIDQLPKGMRKTLYFKDDDSRLSFLQGNFITLTNLKDEDFDRIIKYKISPINISVHTTNPELRKSMLNNNRAGELKKRLTQLADGGIRFNCQIVLCPGINDDQELVSTIQELSTFYPMAASVAIVPVGITKYREGLAAMNGFDEAMARKAIHTVKPLQEMLLAEHGDVFARLSDEFYITAGEEFPETVHYGDFEQLEDGIGMTVFFDQIVSENLEYVDFDGKGNEIGIITGEMSGNHVVFQKTLSKIEEKLNIKIQTYVVKNDFFGGKVSVSGLLTGTDIIAQTKGKITQRAVFLPKNMMKADEEIFLDDLSLLEVERTLGTKLILCHYSGEDIVENIMNEVELWGNQS